MTSDLEAGIEDHFTVSGLSFEFFYEQQRQPLIALAYAVSGSRIAAEDLAQEALVAAFEAWDEIRGKDNPGTWVRRILLNQAASAYRRKLIELRAVARHARDLPVAGFPEVTGEIDRIWGEVRRLPRRQVQMIALAHIDGLNQVEIADTLGISKESVNTHLRRARQTLARALNIEETT
jgi:RNA polymerase sigma-70 factor (ECF subfamily)